MKNKQKNDFTSPRHHHQRRDPRVDLVPSKTVWPPLPIARDSSSSGKRESFGSIFIVEIYVHFLFSYLQDVFVLEANLIWNEFQKYTFQKSIESFASILTRERDELFDTTFCLSFREVFKLCKIFLFRSNDFLTVRLVFEFIEKRDGGSVIP